MKNINVYIVLILFTMVIRIIPQSSFEKAIDFDGNSDYANTFNRPYFPTINGTIEAWVKVRSLIPPGNPLDIGDAFIAKNEEQWNNGDFYVFFDYSDGRVKSRIQKPPSLEVDVVSNNNFFQSFGQWFHYAFTWGSNGMKMYINGVLQNSQNNLTYSALNNDYNFYIGGHGYMLHNGQYVVTDFFDGQMDELRIWNYQKTNEEILSLNNMPLDSSYFSSIDSGLVGYWRFDILEDLGINNDGPDDVRDYSVLHNHLDLAGNAHLVQPDPIIPVELISFVAELRDGKVELIWNTATEVNNHGFEIERSSQGNDWRIVAFIKGKGTTTEIQTYKFIDDFFGASPDKILYRLKQIDLDGQFYYLSEIEVTTLPTNLSLLQNYPNPFNPSTTIKFSLPVSSNVKINIYNALGQLVETLVDKEMESGYHQVNIDASKLSSGVYLYQLLVSALHSKDGKAGSFIQTKKMVLIK